MRIPRIFVDRALPSQGRFVLPESASHYLCKVLRMAEGRALVAFDNSGAEFEAEIVSADKKATEINIFNHHFTDRESPLETHLGIGISRGERMDWVLQKATELGVTTITPLFTERCEVKLSGERLEKKITHWQQVAISACEQCQRNRLPALQTPTSLNAFCEQANSQTKLVLQPASETKLSELTKPTSVSLLIGPEGGLSDVEVSQAVQAGFQALSLGPRILRTETAPIVALTAVQLVWGDLI